MCLRGETSTGRNFLRRETSIGERRERDKVGTFQGLGVDSFRHLTNH